MAANRKEFAAIFFIFCPFSNSVKEPYLHIIFLDALKFSIMETIKEPDSLRLLLYLTITVMGFAVIIIGYFIVKRDNGITAATDNLTVVVEQLKEVVTSMKTQHETRQPIIDAQLEIFRQGFINSASVVDGIDTRLVKLETEHKLLTCKYPTNNITINNNENSN